MRLFCFATGQSNLPHAANPDRAALGLERWREAVAQAGDSGLADFAETVTRDAGTLLTDVAEMRARMDSEHNTDLIWEVKHLRGGLVDVEFITQYLELKHANAHPEILSPNTRTALRRLRDTGLLGAPVADDLIAGLDLWQAIQGLQRLTLEGEPRREADGDIPEGLQETLARVGGAVDFVALKEKVTATAGRIHRHFVDLIEAPARAVAEQRSDDSGRRENGPRGDKGVSPRLRYAGDAPAAPGREGRRRKTNTKER